MGAVEKTEPWLDTDIDRSERHRAKDKDAGKRILCSEFCGNLLRH